jgi:hypothetical protein
VDLTYSEGLTEVSTRVASRLSLSPSIPNIKRTILKMLCAL